MQFLRHFRAGGILLGVLLIAYSIGYVRLPHHKGSRLYKELSGSVESGDSWDAALKVLGTPDIEPTTEEMRYLHEWMLGAAYRFPDRFPEGYQGQDEFAFYSFSYSREPLLYPLKGRGERSGVRLQFRDGELVNHNPAEYATFEIAAAIQ